MPEPLHRCFVSVDLPDDVKMAILAAQRTIGQNVSGLRLTRPENLHLTLKFLGEIDSRRLDEAARRLSGMKWPATSLAVGCTGSFAPRIVWVSIDGAEDLQGRVDDALSGMYEPEERFMGHVTIGRARRLTRVAVDAIEDVLALPIDAPAEYVSLMESTLAPAGPQYRVIRRYGIAPTELH